MQSEHLAMCRDGVRFQRRHCEKCGEETLFTGHKCITCGSAHKFADRRPKIGHMAFGKVMAQRRKDRRKALAKAAAESRQYFEEKSGA